MGLAVDIRGSGSPVVLLHGLTDCRDTWRPVGDRLAEFRTVVAIDLPGHGRSAPAPDYALAALADAVLATLNELEIEAPDLIGHSLGAAVSIFAASGLTASSLVTIDQPLDLVSMKTQLQPLEHQLRDPAGCAALVTALLAEMTATLDPASRTAVEVARRIEPTVILGVFEPFLSTSADSLDRQAVAAIEAVPCRHLTIFGTEPPAQYREWLVTVAPTCAVEIFDGAGHYLHLAEPDRFVDRLRDFWAA